MRSYKFGGKTTSHCSPLHRDIGVYLSICMHIYPERYEHANMCVVGSHCVIVQIVL